MTEPALVTCRDLVAAYAPDRVVLNGVSLALRGGERVALIGANGSGKSTLLEALVGLHRPKSGVVEAFGREQRSEGDFVEVRRRVGLVFEDPDDQLFSVTVAEDVAFGPFNLGWPRERVMVAVREILERLGLAGFEDRVTWRLSRGEKRMVSLATVLVMNPDVLLLDEPTLGLDEQRVALLVRELSASEKTMLVVSHDLDFLRAIATRACRLEDGRIREEVLA